MPVPRLLLDTSVWIAAVGSTTGGSALVLELCGQGRTQTFASRLIFLEAERNIRTKLGREAVLRFYRAIAALNIEVMEPPSSHEIAVQYRIIDRKDAHILATAIKGRVDCLLTLDRKHFMSPKVLHAGLPFPIMTPGDFLQWWVEQHG